MGLEEQPGEFSEFSFCFVYPALELRKSANPERDLGTGKNNNNKNKNVNKTLPSVDTG